MRFNIITLFPEFFDSPLSCGLLARAKETGLVDFNFINPRDFAPGRHKSVDDRPYGGGPGMVMTLTPLLEAAAQVEKPGRIVLLAPSGRPFDQQMAAVFSQEQDLTIICGRYEGIDARLGEIIDLEPVSLGDFVLNGGEAGALCLIETVARLLDGFMGKLDSAEEESFSSGLLEYPHYSRPEDFAGRRVPEVLLSGDHGRVAAWRREKSLDLTLKERPELLDRAKLNQSDLARLAVSPERKRLGANLHIALLHHPVLDRFGQISTSSLTNLDIHDIARNSRTYGLEAFYVVTPLDDQRALLEELLEHWLDGPAAQANRYRAEALALTRPMVSLEQVLEDIRRRRGRRPRVIATSARTNPDRDVGLDQVRSWLDQGPVLLLLGTSWGLPPEIVSLADGTLRPVRCLDSYNHLPVRSAAAIALDRILGDYF